MNEPTQPGSPRPGRLVGLLSGVSFLAYPLRTNITVAAAAMMPDLRLTQVQMGDVFSAFQLPYALFQIPGGFLGDRFGVRPVLTAAVLIWAISSAATGLVPVGASAVTALAILTAARAALGVGQAALYPLGTMAIHHTVPAPFRGRAVAVFLAAAVLGSILTPVVVSQGMVRFGWRATFLAAAGLALVVAAIWHAAAPRAHPPSPSGARLGERVLAAVRKLRDRRLLLLSLSYLCQSAVWYLFVYWFYIYLTDVRGFTVLKGGVFGMAPYLSALVVGPLGGVTLDRLIRRHGKIIGRRVTAMTGMIGAAVSVIAGARLGNPYLAILTLALSAGLVNFVESAYWTTAAELGGDQAGTTAGVLNTVGNLGGVLATALVPRLVAAWGWIPSLLAFGGVATAGALLWLTFRPEALSRSPAHASRAG